MLLASRELVESALRREVVAGEDVEQLILTASDLVTGYLWPTQIPSPTPDPIARVVADMVAAVLDHTPGQEADSMTAGPYSVKLVSGSTGSAPFLTAALKARLRPWKQSMVSVPLASERII